jgi:hypothetical protein
MTWPPPPDNPGFFFWDQEMHPTNSQGVSGVAPASYNSQAQSCTCVNGPGGLMSCACTPPGMGGFQTQFGMGNGYDQDGTYDASGGGGSGYSSGAYLHTSTGHP